MTYASRDETVRIETHEPELEHDGTPAPEFRVRVSRIANGWWSREELTRLRDKLTAALSNSDAREVRSNTEAERLIALAGELNVEDIDLDEVVHENFSFEATAVNNSGIGEQIRYLLTADTPAAVEEIIRGAATSR